MTLAPEDRIVGALKDFPEVRRLWLFGSRARGDHMPRADVDVAVECDAVASGRWLDMVEAADASTLYGVDLVRIDEQEPAFREAILTEGRILYERR